MVVKFGVPTFGTRTYLLYQLYIYWNIDRSTLQIKFTPQWFISNQQNSNQPIAAATASIFEVALVGGLEPKGVEIEALDVPPGKAIAAVGEVSASSTEFSLGA